MMFNGLGKIKNLFKVKLKYFLLTFILNLPLQIDCNMIFLDSE